MCGDCYNALESTMLAFRAGCGNQIDTDQLDVLVRQFINLNTP
jgi:hypothetical protein